MTHQAERSIVNRIKKVFGATRETQKRIWDALEAKYSDDTLQRLYDVAEGEKVSQSFRELVMRGW